MKILSLLCFSFLFSTSALASFSGACVNSRNRDQADQVKVALSNGLLSSLETAELHMAETCREYDRKLQELLDLSRNRASGSSSQVISTN